MKLWCATILITILYVTSAVMAQISGLKPQRGEWICWATNVQEDCGTYGWHKQKSVALKVAIDLCDKVCNPGCIKEYCEQVK